MRFRDILYLLKQHKEQLDISSSKIYGGATTLYNCSSLMDCLLELQKFDFLKKYFKPIEGEGYLKKTFSDEINISNDKFSVLASVVRELQTAVSVAIDLLESNLKVQNQNTVSFKLHEISSFKENNS